MDLARGAASPFLRRDNSESRSAALRRHGSAVIGFPGAAAASSAARNNPKLGLPHSLAQGSSNTSTPPDGSGLPRRSRSGAPVRAAGIMEGPGGKPGEPGRGVGNNALPSLADWGRGANLRDIFDNSPARNRPASKEHWKMACSPPVGRRSAARRQRGTAVTTLEQEANQWRHTAVEQQEEELQYEVEKLLSAALTEPSLPLQSSNERMRERSRSLPSALKHNQLQIGSMRSVAEEERRVRVADDHGDYENNLQRQGTGFVHMSQLPSPSSRVRINDSHGDNENGIQRQGTGYVHLSKLRGSSPSPEPTVRIEDSHGDNENSIQRQGTGFVMFHHVSPRVRIMDSHGDNENNLHRQGTGFVHLNDPRLR